ncbi:unnamed protein product [Paramecium sonneborni]|uniref:Protein kinase domain-containing protein n=1 Tax=Paramecium sonneborni TaxID=65129 RepID=A0A8S1NX81_9CILI|nr:unnamed protein product [Paramecium sonneborni]
MDNQNILIIDDVTYKIQQFIGEGSEGIVQKGENIQNKEIVSIKQYKKFNQNEYNAIQTIKKGNCSHIIEIKAIQQKFNQPLIIIMEYAHGDFNKFIETDDYKCLDYDQKNKYFLQMVQGVSQLHELGFFHRDLKPENFVYINKPNNEKIVKLIDFGLVKETSNKLMSTSCIGSTCYIAPEVLANTNTFYDKSVDIWSLGVIWYEMLTQETFFQGNDQKKVYKNILSITQEEIESVIQNNKKIKQEEKDLISKMLKKKSIQRIQLKDILTAYNQRIQNHQSFQLNNKFMQNQFSQKPFLFSTVKPQPLNKMQFIDQPIQPQQFLKQQNQFLQQSKFQNQKEEQETIKQQQELLKLKQKQEKEEQEKRQKQEKEEQERNRQQQLLELKQKQEKEEQEKKRQEETQKIQLELKKNMEEEYRIKIQQFEYKKLLEINQNLKIKQNKNNKNQLHNNKRLNNKNKIQNSQLKQQNQQQYIEQYKQREQQQREQEIKIQLETFEEDLKKQLEIEIQNKYLLEYSKKVDQLEQNQVQVNLKQLEEKKQSLLILFQSQYNAISIFISNLNQKLQIIKNIETQDQMKTELITIINNQIQKQNQTLKENEDRKQNIQNAFQQEQLRGQDNYITQEIQQNIQEQNKFINQIEDKQMLLLKQVNDRQKIEYQKMKHEKEMDQLNNEKQKFEKQFTNLKQQFTPFSDNIQKFQQKIKFYDEIQQQKYGQEKLMEVIKHYQKLISDFLILEEQEKMMHSLERSCQIFNYQSFNSKIEELQLAQKRLKISIDESNTSLEQIDSKFVDEHHRQIQELADNLKDLQDKFKYLYKNQKYKQKIDQIIIQIGDCFGKLNSMELLLTQELFENYQQFNQIQDSINQNLKEFEKQYDQLHEQIHHDQQIELINAERIQKLKNIDAQLSEFLNKMNQLKIKINDFINYQYCNNEQTKNLVLGKQRKIDQNMNQIQEQFKLFKEFNQFNSYQTINDQIIYLEQFEENLNNLLINEEEQLIQLKLIVQRIGVENKNEQEKEILILKNQFQQKQMQFSKEIQLIKIEADKIQYIKQINLNRENLQKELDDEIQILEKYQEFNQDNQKLFKEKLNQFQNKQGQMPLQQKIVDLLGKQKQYNSQKAQKLEEILRNVYSIKGQLQFENLDNKLIDTYEQFKIFEEQLQVKINELEQNQQNNPTSFQQIISEIKNLILQINQRLEKIPKPDEIQIFKKVFLINSQSYEKLYSLVNYIRQYHLTRYYERFKNDAEKQNKKKKNQQENNYIQVFQIKQNEQMEENTQKEKAAQDLLKTFENILLHNYQKLMIHEIKRDYEQIKKQIEFQENLIKQKNLVRLRAFIKDKQIIKEIIIEKQYFKIIEFSQMLIFEIISNYSKEQY